MPVPVVDAMAKEWRAALTLDDRLALADALWQTNVHEARVAAAKLLEQARIRPDDEPAWRLIASWVPDFDGWALADHASVSGQKRLAWRPARVDELEAWTTSPHMWTRRAALVMTLPWTRMVHPKPADLAIRERVLGWAARLRPRPRLVHPEGHRLVAPRPVETRPRPGAGVPRGARGSDEALRGEGGGAVPCRLSAPQASDARGCLPLALPEDISGSMEAKPPPPPPSSPQIAGG